MMELFYYGCEFVHTAAIVWTIWRIVAQLGRVRVNHMREMFTQALTMVSLASLHAYNSSLGTGVVSNFFILLSVLLLSVVARGLYTNRLSDNFLIGSYVWIVVSLADFLIQTLVYLIWFQSSDVDFLMEVSTGRGIYLLARTLILIVIVNRITSRIKRIVLPVLKHRMWLWGANIVLLCCMVYFQRIYLYKSFDIQEILLNYWWIFCLGVAMIIVLFAAYRVRENEQRKSQLAQMKFELLESSYQQMMKERTTKNILVHDMKNHFITLLRLIEEGEIAKAEKYIREMYVVLESKKNCVITNHLLVDLILDNKIAVAQEKGIQIDAESDDLSGMQLSDMETCSLFANLLDNAIEANERCDSGNGWVEITCSRKDKLLILSMVNPTDKNVTPDMGLPETTKENKKLHGFGMRGIQQIADAYGGYMNYHVEDGKFHITVCISVFV